MKTYNDLTKNAFTYHEGAWWYRAENLQGKLMVPCPKCGQTIMRACKPMADASPTINSLHPCGALLRGVF